MSPGPRAVLAKALRWLDGLMQLASRIQAIRRASGPSFSGLRLDNLQMAGRCASSAARRRCRANLTARRAACADLLLSAHPGASCDTASRTSFYTNGCTACKATAVTSLRKEHLTEVGEGLPPREALRRALHGGTRTAPLLPMSRWARSGAGTLPPGVRAAAHERHL